jgi:translation initiation factor 5A
MALKLITAHDARPGATILVEGHACIVRGNDISKTGKHGASKCRIEAIGILDDKKRVLAVPGHERFEVPMIEKRKAQVLSVNTTTNLVNVMDMETFDNLDLPVVEEIRGQLNPEDQIEYYIIDEKLKVIKRKV